MALREHQLVSIINKSDSNKKLIVILLGVTASMWNDLPRWISVYINATIFELKLRNA